LSSSFQGEGERPENEVALSELLFELSSTDRLRLLSIARSDHIKLSQLAQKASATVQETARHLERLTVARLIDKNASGGYFLTSLGSFCLDQIASLKFAVENREYILEHDFTSLPEEFLHRLGELLKSDHAKNVSEIFRYTETVMSEAEKYVFLMADQALVPTNSPEGAAANQDGKVSWRSIIPYSIYLSLPKLRSVPQNIELRFLDSPKVAIAMNEQIAGVCFPNLK